MKTSNSFLENENLEFKSKNIYNEYNMINQEEYKHIQPSKKQIDINDEKSQNKVKDLSKE